MGYLTIGRPGQGETEEKKSRFIGIARHAESEEEAQAVIAAVRKEHYNARHHCFAYVLGKDGKQMRASDDGEPQGTAGRPILSVLTGAKVTNALIVVIRYFGGTLLGTGGLVRCYGAAAKAALEDAEILERKQGMRLEVRAAYPLVGKLQYLFAEENVRVEDTGYGEDVCFTLILPRGDEKKLERKLAELSSGQIRTRALEEVEYDG